jgi:hypothetical protein
MRAPYINLALGSRDYALRTAAHKELSCDSADLPSTGLTRGDGQHPSSQQQSDTVLTLLQRQYFRALESLVGNTACC